LPLIAKISEPFAVTVHEVRELAGAVTLFKMNEFQSKKGSYESIIADVNSFTPLHIFYISGHFFSKNAKILCDNSNIIPIDIVDLTYILHKAISSRELTWTTKSKFDNKKFIAALDEVEVIK